jgi:hypothetical protein
MKNPVCIQGEQGGGRGCEVQCIVTWWDAAQLEPIPCWWPEQDTLEGSSHTATATGARSVTVPESGPHPQVLKLCPALQPRALTPMQLCCSLH